jgi:hypothetical protein
MKKDEIFFSQDGNGLTATSAIRDAINNNVVASYKRYLS